MLLMQRIDNPVNQMHFLSINTVSIFSSMTYQEPNQLIVPLRAGKKRGNLVSKPSDEENGW